MDAAVLNLASCTPVVTEGKRWIEASLKDTAKSASWALVESDASIQHAFLQWRKSKQKAKKEGKGQGTLPMPVTRDVALPDTIRKQVLRKMFVDIARSYIGVPYARRCHEPSACCCEGCTELGHQLFHEPLFLDCCGLVLRVARRMQAELGFRLGPMNQAYQFDTLPIRVDSIQQLEPGDLIFYSGSYFNPEAKRHAFDMTHVEIFVGGSTGEATIGSRERYKWVMEYDSYRFESKRWSLIRHYFCKLDPWLEGKCMPQHADKWKLPWGTAEPDLSSPSAAAAAAAGAGATALPKATLAWDTKKYSILGDDDDMDDVQEAGDD